MSRRILVIEDTPATRRLVTVTLGAEGYEVLEAPDGSTALRLVDEVRPDLILQDMLLPDMDGFSLIVKLRARPALKDVPILAFSGYLESLQEARSRELGFSGFLFKPVEPSRLVRTVKLFLPQDAVTEARRGDRREVLVVDDDPLGRKLLVLRLEQLGFVVTSAGDGVEALERALKRPPAAVVADALMPRMDGFELCRAIRSHPGLTAVPVVLMSAYYDDEADGRLALRIGASAFVRRTPSMREVVDALFFALANPAPRPKPAEFEATRHEHAQRVLQQLERQVAMNRGLVQTSAILAAQVAILSGVSEVLRRNANIEETLDGILAGCLEGSSDLTGGLIYLIKPGRELELAASRGHGLQPDRLRDFFSHMELLREVSGRGALLRMSSARLIAGEPPDLLSRADVKSLILCPLVCNSERMGVLVLLAQRSCLGEEWENYARALAGQISLAIGLARALLERAAAEGRFRELVEGLDAIAWEADRRRSKHCFVSARAVSMLGYRLEDWSRPDFWIQHVHRDDRERVMGKLERDVASGATTEFEYRAFDAEGRMHWLQDRVRPFQGHAGGQGLRGLTLDVTQRRALEEQLTHAQRMEAVGRLAAGVAHDFNNMLTFILGRTSLLMDRPDTEAIRKELGQIRKSAQSAAGLTRQLLTFGRRQVLAPRAIDLNELIRSILPMLSNLAGDKVELTTVLAPKLGQVEADPAQMEQLLVNLVVNAKDAMPRGGTLTLWSENVELDQRFVRSHPGVSPGAYVMIAVQDTGVGMDAETRAHIFEPFFTTKQLGRGTGLGLSTVYGSVKQAHGSIWVESEPGQGSTFKIFLPRSRKPAAREPLPADGPSNSSAPRQVVLVAEDEPDLRELVAQMVESAGYRVLTAADGVEALSVVGSEEGKIDALVTDVVMPRMGGSELAQALRQRRPELPILFVSGYPDSMIKQGGVLSPSIHFLQKPFTFESFTQKLHALLAEAPASRPETEARPP